MNKRYTDARRFCNSVIVVNYTGRRGGGALDAYEMAKGLVDNGERVVPIISSEIENLAMWKKVPFERLVIIDTYDSIISCIVSTILFGMKKRPLIRKAMEGLMVKAVYCPMGTVWSDRINAIFPEAKTVMTIHDPVPHSGTKWYIRCFSRSRHTYDAIIVHSKTFVEQVRRMRQSSERVEFIPLGRHSMYRDIKDKKKIISYHADCTNFIFFGRIEDYKGLDILAKAWSVIDAKYHEKVTLSIIGNGSFMKYEAAYEAFTNVKIINRWIEDSEIESIFTGENLICVCPYKDGTQSGVILVAMDYGVPTIASDTGGLGEQIVDGETGLLIQAGSVDELIAAMEKFIGNEGILAKMRTKMEEYIAGISWNKSAFCLAELIGEIT